MKIGTWFTAAFLTFVAAVCVRAQDAPRGLVGPIRGERYTTEYVRLGRQGEGLLFRPAQGGANARIAAIYTHPMNENLTFVMGPELATRGFIAMNINYRGSEAAGPEADLPTISQAIAYLRTLPGVQKVVLVGHSGGANQVVLYENVAEHGAAACKGPEKIYPCRGTGLDKLGKPDGLVVLDPPLGAFHAMSSVDPAVGADAKVRDAGLDMFTAANGFDAAAGRATYSAEFEKRWYAAQSAKSNTVTAQALERLKVIEAGGGAYKNDEPLVVPGLGVEANGARLYQTDLSLQEHTKAAHTLLKADGTRSETVIHTVRPAQAASAKQLDVLGATSMQTTVRGYLSHSAIRTTAEYAITADDIKGVEWASAYDSAPGNAPGVTIPTLVLTMGCHYLVVPGEIVYDRLGSKDKTYATVEGSTHVFQPCKPEYGDTTKRTFDFVAEWMNKAGRL